MRGPFVLVGAAAAMSTVVVTGLPGGSASAGQSSSSSVPSVSVPVPSVSVPVPSVTVPDPPDPTGGSGGGDGGGGGSDPGGGSADDSGGDGATSGSGAGSANGGRDGVRRAGGSVRPMIADRPQARLLLDDESSLALRAASKDFLAADRQIAAINRQQRAKTAARATAARAAADYRTLGVEADTARAWAVSMHEAYDGRRDLLAAYARRAYQTGRPFDDADIASLVEVAGRLGDSATRAELRLAAVLMSQEQARKDFDQATARYQQASRALATMKTRLAALAERRSAALDRVRAARSGDLALHQARLAESGALGAQIRAASARLRATGRAVDGTGVFVRPGSGMVTSGFGMRRHPILHYTKLHTGTDFSQGDGTAYAANTGRVLFTLVSEAYGNMTVIDHGTVRGRHIATLYAHQARVLVRDGQRVHRGQPIGVIGSTGYSTGPHLHFEVRQDGAPMEPLLWLR